MRRLTIMLVADSSARIRRIRVSKSTIWIVASIVCLGLSAMLAVGIHYYSIIEKISQNKQMRGLNLQLSSRLERLYAKVSSIQPGLVRLQRFDTKLRIMTQLHDKQRHLALGPVESGGFGGFLTESDGEIPSLVRVSSENTGPTIDFIEKRLDELTAEIGEREASTRHLDTLLQGRKIRLAATPSICPTSGWVTADFGTRLDPFTGKFTMHKGIDIANQPGVPVISPARGVVTFASNSDKFGKLLVLDHGYGIRTRYGHLNEFRTAVGRKVERREIIGTIGNSGRSTGPHLHYEVIVDGVCKNPKYYMLED
ncbi:MAG: M23 family metallopeptidase [Deltaproteobacteria bacterium]|nr:M23 family metallopeptidase [Deltaproteobacteria bacterium]